MTIAITVVARVGPAFSEGEVSASESHDGTPAENYYLENYHILKKIRTDDVGHKSPKKQTNCGAVVKRTKKKDKKSSSSAKMASSPESKLNLEDFFPMTRVWIPSCGASRRWMKTVCPSTTLLTRLILVTDGPRQWKLS